jgi:hypothetical protein
MTDEVQQQAAQGEQTQQQGAVAQQPPAGPVATGGDPGATQSAPTVEDVEAKRNEENLARAKANGYVDPPQPSISERVAALIAGVQHAMEHNSPISLEHLEEMKALLGHRGE